MAAARNGSIPAGTATAPAKRIHHGATFAVLAIAALAFSLLQSMIIPAIPELEHVLHSSATGATWLLTAYLLSAAIATPIPNPKGEWPTVLLDSGANAEGSPALLLAVTHGVAGYFDDSVRAVITEFLAERQRAIAQSVAERRRLVAALVAGAEVPLDVAAAQQTGRQREHNRGQLARRRACNGRHPHQ